VSDPEDNTGQPDDARAVPLPPATAAKFEELRERVAGQQSKIGKAAAQAMQAQAKVNLNNLAPGIDVGPDSAIGRAARMLDEVSERVPHFDPIQIPEMPEIDLSNTPDQRAARAAEETADYMGLLVEAARIAELRAAEAEARADEAERRENTMLGWTQAGVVFAAIAAVVGVIAIIVTLAVA
jgi:hypothetical protein